VTRPFRFEEASVSPALAKASRTRPGGVTDEVFATVADGVSLDAVPPSGQVQLNVLRNVGWGGLAIYFQDDQCTHMVLTARDGDREPHEPTHTGCSKKPVTSIVVGVTVAAWDGGMTSTQRRQA
jgi:hypothetical protein